MTRNVVCFRKQCAVGKQETVVEVAELKKFEFSIILMRMGMIKKKDVRGTAEVWCARWRLKGCIGERMLKMELLGG